MKFKIFTANHKDYQTIKKWNDDANTSGNLIPIQNSYKRNELVVLKIDGFVVGYCSYNLSYGSIDLIEIQNEYRYLNLGKSLVEHIIGKFLEKNKSEVKIIASPYSSINFWVKIGFREDPNNHLSNTCNMIKKLN